MFRRRGGFQDRSSGVVGIKTGVACAKGMVWSSSWLSIVCAITMGGSEEAAAKVGCVDCWGGLKEDK